MWLWPFKIDPRDHYRSPTSSIILGTRRSFNHAFSSFNHHLPHLSYVSQTCTPQTSPIRTSVTHFLIHSLCCLPPSLSLCLSHIFPLTSTTTTTCINGCSYMRQLLRIRADSYANDDNYANVLIMSKLITDALRLPLPPVHRRENLWLNVLKGYNFTHNSSSSSSSPSQLPLWAATSFP